MIELELILGSFSKLSQVRRAIIAQQISQMLYAKRMLEDMHSLLPGNKIDESAFEFITRGTVIHSTPKTSLNWSNRRYWFLALINTV